ncbi:hypothetical protein LTR56_002689 [Elasticomyces elasticus]|nr:hypothetical protein LTR22_014895 [Elasticomyces elasticus]KAK3657173.1 hypothetical protein LTR56_002689 [Elasticomyces elasticus]KAK4914354.1 hypothetical protein LTR49_017385 [Elasticomyces elasticus]KAK5753865.1 hypothetical protein LTS12_016068 [Elasticomyces elasticus]
MDPVSITIAAIGGAFWIFQIVTTVVPEVVKKVDSWKAYEISMQHFLHKTDSARTRFQSWHVLYKWSHDLFKARLEDAYGKETCAKVQRRLEVVQKIATKVQSLLDIKSEEERSSLASLKRWLDNHSQRLSVIPVKGKRENHIGEFERYRLDQTFPPSQDARKYQLRWILWREEQLKDHLGKLNDAIEELLQYSSSVLTDADHLSYRDRATERILKEDLQRCEFWNNANDLFTTLHEPDLYKANDFKIVQEGQWSVILSDVESADQEDAGKEKVNNFSLAFACPVELKDYRNRGGPIYSGPCYWRQRLIYKEASNSAAGLIPRSFTTTGTRMFEDWSRWPARNNKRIESEFQVPSMEWTKDLRAMLEGCLAEQALELERARIASVVCMWVVLLWGTKWVSGLCSCCVRGIVQVRSPKKAELLYCLKPGSDRAQHFGESTQHKQNVRALGVLLLEMFLGVPVDEVPGLDSDAWEAVRQFERDKERKFRTGSIRNAVVWCLSSIRMQCPDDSPPNGLGNGIERFSEQGRKDLVDKVLRPASMVNPKRLQTLKVKSEEYISNQVIATLKEECLFESSGTTLQDYLRFQDIPETAKQPISSEIPTEKSDDSVDGDKDSLVRSSDFEVDLLELEKRVHQMMTSLDIKSTRLS